jgi:L-arabinose isomerase
MIDFANLEIWFVTGSQHLYGPETLQKVAEHATAIAKALGASSQVPVKVVFKPVMTGSDSIHQLCLESNSS